MLLSKRHVPKILIAIFIVSILFMREISIYWVTMTQKYREINKGNTESFKIGEFGPIGRELDPTKPPLNLEQILQPIWTASDEQQMIDPKTIITTLKFMIQETHETDSELVDFVRSLIIYPPSAGSNRKLKLKNPQKLNNSHTYSSQLIDELLEKKTKGFFIEAGANDGEDISNTLFFELERGWTGLLIEPIPSFFQILTSKNRNAFALNACIAKDKPSVSKFRIHHSLSGRMAEMQPQHMKRIDVESGSTQPKIGYFPCFSLMTILKAIEVSHVDYFSLDVEGGELEVLKNIDFEKIDIEAFSIEHNGFDQVKNNINDFMASKSYKLEKQDGQDGYFKKSKKFLGAFF